MSSDEKEAYSKKYDEPQDEKVILRITDLYPRGDEYLCLRNAKEKMAIQFTSVHRGQHPTPDPCLSATMSNKLKALMQSQKQ